MSVFDFAAAENMVSEPAPRRPGGRLASRPLHFIWLADGSGSMRAGGKIEALNLAIQGAIPYMRAVALDNPHAAVFVNAIRFADDARWMGERLTPVSEFQWHDLEAGGATALGEALTMVGEALQAPLITDRALSPILVLVTDGLPTDDFRAGVDHLLTKPWGRQALRIVVALGEDAASDDAREVFRTFMANDALKPFPARSPEALADQVRWISTAVLQAVVSPSGQILQPLTEAEGGAGAAALLAGVDIAATDEVGVW